MTTMKNAVARTPGDGAPRRLVASSARRSRRPSSATNTAADAANRSSTGSAGMIQRGHASVETLMSRQRDHDATALVAACAPNHSQRHLGDRIDVRRPADRVRNATRRSTSRLCNQSWWLFRWVRGFGEDGADDRVPVEDEDGCHDHERGDRAAASIARWPRVAVADHEGGRCSHAVDRASATNVLEPDATASPMAVPAASTGASPAVRPSRRSASNARSPKQRRRYRSYGSRLVHDDRHDAVAERSDHPVVSSNTSPCSRSSDTPRPPGSGTIQSRPAQKLSSSLRNRFVTHGAGPTQRAWTAPRTPDTSASGELHRGCRDDEPVGDRGCLKMPSAPRRHEDRFVDVGARARSRVDSPRSRDVPDAATISAAIRHTGSQPGSDARSSWRLCGRPTWSSAMAFGASTRRRLTEHAARPARIGTSAADLRRVRPEPLMNAASRSTVTARRVGSTTSPASTPDATTPWPSGARTRAWCVWPGPASIR